MTSDPTLLVLASLADGDKHGYAMMEDIERFAGIRLGPGTLYGGDTSMWESDATFQRSIKGAAWSGMIIGR